MATVSLIPKSVLANATPAVEPICLLNSMGKLYERLMKKRLEVAIDEAGGLNER